MRHASHHRSLRMFCCFLVIVSFILPTSSTHPTTIHAAGTDVPHCTDWPAASYQDENRTSNRDTAITSYEAFVVTPTESSYFEGAVDFVPKSNGSWRVLVRSQLWNWLAPGSAVVALGGWLWWQRRGRRAAE